MKELSIFIDESGDFGEYEPHSPFYLVTLVFHDQSIDISENVTRLHEAMTRYGVSGYTVHAGPIIRRENEFLNFSIVDRKKLFDSLFHFVRLADITYHSIIVEKKNLIGEDDLVDKIKKQLSWFLSENAGFFMQYDRMVIYYDYGQIELTNILESAFNSIFNNVEFKKANPADYRLFQAADMLCSLELLALKAEKNMLSKSELLFFASSRTFRKAYLKTIHRKRFSK